MVVQIKRLVFLIFLHQSLFTVAQVDSAGLVTAGMIYFETVSINLKDAAEIQSREFVSILAPPFHLQVLGTFADNGGYFLRKKDDVRVFLCTANTDGITFLPATQNKRTATKEIRTTETDTILGFRVTKKISHFDKREVVSWETDSLDWFSESDIPIVRMVLASEQVHDGIHTQTRAKDIKLLHLHPKYFSPELSHAPVTFQTELPAFFEMAYRLSPVENRQHQITGFIPQRRPSLRIVNAVPNPQLQTGSRIPNVRGRLFNRDEKFNMRDQEGKVNLFILADYEVLQPVPPFLMEWIKTCMTSYPEIQVMVLTPSHKNQITRALMDNRELAGIPHFVLPLQVYKMFEWQDPLSYVVTDRNLKIVFMESAFDVHQLKPVTEALQSVY